MLIFSKTELRLRGGFVSGQLQRRAPASAKEGSVDLQSFSRSGTFHSGNNVSCCADGKGDFLEKWIQRKRNGSGPRHAKRKRSDKDPRLIRRRETSAPACNRFSRGIDFDGGERGG